MREANTIVGEVSAIVDEENIFVEPRHDGGNRAGEPAAREKVHIDRIKLDEIVWLTGRFSRKFLETILWRRKVTCRIKSREKMGTINADVYLS